MNREKQIEMLNESVEDWNKHREDNPGLSPDLRRSDLRYADLKGANLS